MPVDPVCGIEMDESLALIHENDVVIPYDLEISDETKLSLKRMLLD